MIVQPFPNFFPLVLWLLLTSCSSLLLRIFSVCKTSSGKHNHLHLIYLLYLRLEIRAVLDFVLFRKLIHFKHALYTVSVRQTEVLPVGTLFSPHIRLPSDSTSRGTPLSSANSSYCQVCSGLSPPSDCSCRAHHKSSPSDLQVLTGSFVCSVNFFDLVLYSFRTPSK